MEEKLILIISQHYRFGWKFNIRWAREFKDGSLEILGVPNVKEAEQKGLSEINIKLIKLIDEVSDVSLMKAYSRQKSLIQFMDEVTVSTIQDIIRPRIEINIRRVINLAPQFTLPIYLREDLSCKTLNARNHVNILPEFSHCLFNFVKDKDGLRYFISLTNEEQEISLQKKPVCILSMEPCIIILESEIHRVENIVSKKLVPFFDKKYIPVPATAEKTYIQNFILKIIPKYEVKIEGIEMNELCPVRQAVLTLKEDFYLQPALFLHFKYNHHKINPVLRKIKFVELVEIDGNESICWFQRDVDWEKQLINKLYDLGLRLEGDNRFYLQHNPDILQNRGLISWLNTSIADLSDFTIEQNIGKTFYTGSISLKSNLDIKPDWFDIDINVVFNHCSIPFASFRKHILNRVIEYILPDKSVFILPEMWFHHFDNLCMHGKETEGRIRISKIHVGLLNESISAMFSEKKKQELQNIKQLSDERPVPSPRLNATLRPYQKDGFYWLTHLHNNGLGGCLADDMGLGKTLQVIALLDYIYYKTETKETQPSQDGQLSLFSQLESTLPASLVVMPKSLLHNWQNELKRFAPELKVYMYAGNNRNRSNDISKIFNHNQVIITSYSIVRTDIEYLTRYPFHYIILDESQMIKNPDSMLYESITGLNSSHKLILTGTPIENSLSDLWAQFNFVNKGLLGSFLFFKNYYIQKIKENNSRMEQSLQQLIKPVLLRRTKEEVTPDLPSLLQEIVICDMTETHRELYEIEKNRIRNDLLKNKENTLKNNFIALQGLTRLRLLANHPRLIHPDYKEDSGKLDQIILYYESLRASGHKVLIFSSFIKHLKLLSDRFDLEGWQYAMLTGHTSDREAEINKFHQNKDVNCFFITLKTGGLGLNLTAADYVFIIDPWWNPAAEIQAISRAHRIGQDKNVIVYRFISNDSIEEKIIRLQQSKQQLFDTFITSNNPLANLNKEEIEELFL